MKLTILWSETALLDFESQLEWIAKESPQGARLVKDRLNKAVLSLSDMPVGRMGRVPGTYEKYVPKTSLIIAFEKSSEHTIAILRIIHGKRHWPSGEWPTG